MSRPARRQLYSTYDNGRVVCITVDPNGQWVRSVFLGDLITLDFGADGDLIAVEIIVS